MQKKKNHPPGKQSGFTLIEILIALAIFAVIGVAAAACLHQMIVFRARITHDSAQWRTLAIARLLINKDFENAVAIAPKDFNAQSIQPFSGSAASLSFVRWNKAQARILHNAPIFMPVQYQLNGNMLSRTGSGQEGQQQSMTLLKGVSQLSFHYLNVTKQWVQQWPDNPSGAQYGVKPISTLPIALEVMMTLKGVGTVQWVFSRPAVSG